MKIKFYYFCLWHFMISLFYEISFKLFLLYRNNYEINNLKLYYKINNKTKTNVEDKDIDNLVTRDN